MSNTSKSDPIQQFIQWYKDAKKCKSIAHPDAMCLATADENGFPNARIMLLKFVDKKGFVFFTNQQSTKGKELTANSQACILFYWEGISRQVRIRGQIEKTKSTFIDPLLNASSTKITFPHLSKKELSETDIEADAYFKTRPRVSQLGAWASQQSEEIDSLSELKETVDLLAEKFTNQDVPRPPYWGGYRLVPTQIEFWVAKEFRLHDRTLYVKDGKGNWTTKILSP